MYGSSKVATTIIDNSIAYLELLAKQLPNEVLFKHCDTWPRDVQAWLFWSCLIH